jgi:hypothetical protein
MKRRKTVSVTPAMGARTVAGAIETEPICRRSATACVARTTASARSVGLSQNLRTWLFYSLPFFISICHNLHHTIMGATPNPPAPEPVSPGKWIARVILAVIVGEAIWGLLVSLTNGLIVPGLARLMGGDPQSPVYLGKGDFNLTATFVSILELCLAGIVALCLYQWSRSGPARVRVKTVKVKTVAAKSSMPSIAPPPAAATPPPVATRPPATINELAVALAASLAQPVEPPPEASKPAQIPRPVAPPPLAHAPTPAAVLQPKPQAPSRPASPKPEKPKKPQEVYYNIVGEPISPMEEDE